MESFFGKLNPFQWTFNNNKEHSMMSNKTVSLEIPTSCSGIRNIEENICEKKQEERIRELAYYLWEEAGRPDCDGSSFWIEAEKQFS